LSKLFLAAAICGAAARLCLLAVPGPAALPLAIVAGAATYLALVRVLRALPPGDIDKLGAVAGLLPGPLGGPVEAVLRFLDGDPLSGRKPWLRSCGPG